MDLSRNIILEIDLNTGHISTTANNYFYNTDRNIAYFYIKLYRTNLVGEKQYISDTDSSQYNVSITTIKPKTISTVKLLAERVANSDIDDNIVYKITIPNELMKQQGFVYCEGQVIYNNQELTTDCFSFKVNPDKLTEYNLTLITDPDLPVLQDLILQVKQLKLDARGIDDSKISDSTVWSSEYTNTKFAQVDSQIKDIENKKVTVFNTVSDMLNDTTLELNSRCKTLGFRKEGDGGGGYYIVTEDTPNGCNILKINNSLSAKLIIEDVVNFKQVGANGWGQNDLLSNYFTTLEDAKLTYPNATSLNMTINDVLFKIVLENFKDLYIPEGVFYFNCNISIPSYKNIRGAGNKQTFLKQNTTIQFVTLDGHYISLSDLIIVSNQANKADYGIVINQNRNFNTFNNIIIQYFKKGIRINTNSFLTDLNSVSIFDCTDIGIDVADENNVLNLDKCKINGCNTGLQCTSARNINITNSWIELCEIGILKKDKGNLNITNTYFERNTIACIKVDWGITPCELIKVNGCSFFTNTSNSIINYHGLLSTKLIIENSYFIEYDTNNDINSKVFEKGNIDTTMKPIFKNCYLDGIEIGLTESDYII